MSRNPELEAILQAKFDLDNCSDDEQKARQQHYHELLDAAAAKVEIPGMRRRQLEELLLEPYREFRLSKMREERAGLSRLR